MAASGNYSPNSFMYGIWGTVSSPGNDNVAWVQCATTFACLVNGESMNHGSIVIDTSYWGVEGFVVTNASSVYGDCLFRLGPGLQRLPFITLCMPITSGQTCGLGAFGTHYYNGLGGTGVDYVMWVGNLTWNAGACRRRFADQRCHWSGTRQPRFCAWPSHLGHPQHWSLHDLRPQLREWRGEQGVRT